MRYLVTEAFINFNCNGFQSDELEKIIGNITNLLEIKMGKNSLPSEKGKFYDSLSESFIESLGKRGKARIEIND